MPENPTALHFMGLIAGQQGDPAKAISFISRATELKPDYQEAFYNLGNTYLMLNNFIEAEKAFKKSLELNPENPAAYSNLGNALRKQDRHDEAILNFQKAVELEPDYAIAYYNLGNTFVSKKMPDKAIPYYKKAVSIQPDFVQAYFNLGNSLNETASFSEAEHNFRIALGLRPDWIEAMHNLGNTLLFQFKIKEAIEVFNKILAVKPSWAEIHFNLAYAFLCQGKAKEAAEGFRRAIFYRPGYEEAYSNMLIAMQYSDQLTDKDWHTGLKIFAAYCKSKPVINEYKNHFDPAKRLRIGYVSPDFRNHSCESFFIPLIESHDKEKFEIFCYSGVKTPDELTENIKNYADGWYDITSLSNRDLVNLVYEHQVDILVDLAGHTLENRLLVFASKPAPVQVTWLGFPASTGLEAINYKLSDPWLTPEGTTEYFSEQVWNLSRPVHCYKKTGLSQPPDELPCLANNFITFGSFNNLAKISGKTLDLWGEVLKSIPESRLAIKGLLSQVAEQRERIYNRLGIIGIEPDRIRFYDWEEDMAAHLSLYRNIDIALDTFPYNGATTTVEALWMGVPVISLSGNRSAARYGFSLLNAAGLTDFLATDPEEFVTIAIKLANDREMLKELRGSLRDKLTGSSLCDKNEFTRAVENAFRQMWEIRCNKGE
jgi:protein O-GlcNAc transferase